MYVYPLERNIVITGRSSRKRQWSQRLLPGGDDVGLEHVDEVGREDADVVDVVDAAAVDGVGEEAVDQLPVDVGRVAGQQLIDDLRRWVKFSSMERLMD
jgi:hypothetical protein